MTHQLQFDMTRAEQGQLIQAVGFEGNGRVSRRMLKSLLSIIDDHARLDGECFASQETLARIANCSVPTIKRAIEELEARSLITNDKRKNRFGVVTNHYRIVWNELALLVDHQSHSGRQSRTQPSACPARGRKATVSADPRSASVGPRSAREPGFQAAPTVSSVSQSVSSVCPTISSVCTDRGISLIPKREEQYQPPPTGARAMAAAAEDSPPQPPLRGDPTNVFPPSPSGRGAGGEGSSDPSWDAVRSALQATGLAAIAKAVRIASIAGIAPGEALGIVGEYHRHASRLRSPGAIVHRFENGTWPVELASPRPPQQTLTPERLLRLRESIRCGIAREWQAAGRWATATEAEVQAEIDRRLSRGG